MPSSTGDTGTITQQPKRRSQGASWNNLSALSRDQRERIVSGSWASEEPSTREDTAATSSGGVVALDLDSKEDPDFKYLPQHTDPREKRGEDDTGSPKTDRAMVSFANQADMEAFQRGMQDPLLEEQGQRPWAGSASLPSSLRVSMTYHQDLVSEMDRDLGLVSGGEGEESRPRTQEELEENIDTKKK